MLDNGPAALIYEFMNVESEIQRRSNYFIELVEGYDEESSYHAGLNKLKEKYDIEIGTDDTVEPGYHPETDVYVDGYPFEVSMPTSGGLRGEEALKLFREFSDELQKMGAGVNDTAGLHVHIGKGNLTEDQLGNVLRAWAKYEWAVDELYGEWRRGDKGYHGTPSIYGRGLKRKKDYKFDAAINYIKEYDSIDDAVADLHRFAPKEFDQSKFEKWIADAPEIKRLQSNTELEALDAIKNDPDAHAYVVR